MASISEQAKAIVTEYFSANAAADKCISAEQLADLVGRNGKTVRDHLRRIAARDQSEYKGARWRISRTLALKVVTHYLRRDAEKAESETEVEEKAS